MIWCVDCLLTAQFNEKSVADAMGRYDQEEAAEKEHSDQHTTPHSPDTTTHLALLGGWDAVGPSKLNGSEEDSPSATKSTKSEDKNPHQAPKSTPSSKKATEARAPKNVARRRRSVVARGGHAEGKTQFITKVGRAVVAKGEAKTLAQCGVHGGMGRGGGGEVVGEGSRKARTTLETLEKVGTPSGASMSVATQWRQEQRRALDANQRWKQEQRRLLEELLGDAGIMQLLPKFIEEEVGYETIILPNFGREEMEAWRKSTRDETM